MQFLSVDLDRGAEVLSILDKAGLRVDIALWVTTSEHEDWRLIISARTFEGLGMTDARRVIHRSLMASGLSIHKWPTMTSLPWQDRFIQGLRHRYANMKDVEGLRPGGQLIGDRLVLDGYVYRLS